MVDEPIAFDRAGDRPSARNAYPGGTGARRSAGWLPGRVKFDRRELDRILDLYGHMVAAGEWRDYAIDFLAEAAVFSVFRRASEMSLYRIEKRPKLRTRQGQYAIVAASGHVLKRGHELSHVLRVLEKKLFKAVRASE